MRNRRLSSQLTIGLIGQGAAGREIRTFIHERTGNTIPQGWQNQIRNDVILNDAVVAEQRIAASGNAVALWSTVGARAGTFQTSLSVGGTLLAGRGEHVSVAFFRTQTGRECAAGRVHRTVGIVVGVGRR